MLLALTLFCARRHPAGAAYSPFHPARLPLKRKSNGDLSRRGEYPSEKIAWRGRFLSATYAGWKTALSFRGMRRHTQRRLAAFLT